MPEPVDPRHLLLIGAGPGVGAGVVRRFGREGFRSTLISRGATLDQLGKAASGYHARVARKLSPSDVVSLQRGLRRLLEALEEVDPVSPTK